MSENENQEVNQEDLDEWYPNFLRELTDHLEQEDPEGFQQMVERVKAWKNSESDRQ